MKNDRTDTSETLDSLFRDHRSAVTAHIRRYVREDAARDDIVQETFFRAWKNRDQWPDIRSFRSWLLRIATNLSLNHIRSRNRSRERLFVEFGDDADQVILEKALTDFANPGPESEVVRETDRALVRRLISELPDEKRIVLELIDEEDRSIKETSDILGIPDGTVKSRLHYGRRELSGHLHRLFDTEDT